MICGQVYIATAFCFLFVLNFNAYETLGIVLDEVDPTLFDPECVDLINIVLDFLIPGCNFVSS